MTWTKITRKNYDRRGGRYASDMRDREWMLIEPFMPPREANGQPRTTDLRDVMNAIGRNPSLPPKHGSSLLIP